ncbi:hypothetical protein G9A89_018149 [Geosiphon pyriformis]|nr:hypothetical protein G9A89_018149 [Geosiphon pyriformis]
MSSSSENPSQIRAIKDKIVGKFKEKWGAIFKNKEVESSGEVQVLGGDKEEQKVNMMPSVLVGNKNIPEELHSQTDQT